MEKQEGKLDVGILITNTAQIYVSTHHATQASKQEDGNFTVVPSHTA